MLDPFKAQIRVWIEEDPTLSPAVVLQRLMGADPSRFTKKCERTVQIAVKAWRAEITGQIIIHGDWVKDFAVSSPASAGDDTTHLAPG